MSDPVAGWKMRGDGQWTSEDLTVVCCTPEQNCTTLPHDVVPLPHPGFRVLLPGYTHAQLADQTCRLTFTAVTDRPPEPITPLPEPADWLAMAVGLVALACLWRLRG